MNSASPAGYTCDDHQALLTARVGVHGSGAARYAAAMHFYTQRQMPVDMLEIYRRCSKFDNEDPIDLARFEGITVPQIARADDVEIFS